MIDSEPDYLDEMIRVSIEDDPGFASIWAPYAQMLALSDERVRLGLSQQDVADRMGVNRAAVSRMETNPGRVAFERILRYAHAIGAELVLKPAEAEPKKSANGRGRKVGSGAKAKLAA